MALNCENFAESWIFSCTSKESEGMHYEGIPKPELGSSSKVSSLDSFDCLPVDPFGMGIRSGFTTYSSLIQDCEKGMEESFFDFSMDEFERNIGDDRIFSGVNLVWSSLTMDEISSPSSSFSGFGISNGDFDFDGEKSIADNGGFSLNGEKGIIDNGSFGFSGEKGVVDNGDTVLNGDIGNGGFGFNGEKGTEYGSFAFNGGKGIVDSNGGFASNGEKGVDNGGSGCDNDEGGGRAPHDALFFALGYLGTKDLLVMERVCKSFRDVVRSDPLLWRSIHIDQPLSEKIEDDDLVNLSSRAQGALQCLSLVQCFRITDHGVKRVLESNPRLMKLGVPGCSKVSVEGILFNLRAFNSLVTPGIKYLRIGGLFGITNHHFEEFKSLIGVDFCVNQQEKTHQPKFLRRGQKYLSCEDDRQIDIESCPKCGKLGLVYDCPSEQCKEKRSCRACTVCILRCVGCGGCIGDLEHEETFSLHFLCRGCSEELLGCEEESGGIVDSSSKEIVICRETRYEFCYRG